MISGQRRRRIKFYEILISIKIKFMRRWSCRRDSKCDNLSFNLCSFGSHVKSESSQAFFMLSSIFSFSIWHSDNYLACTVVIRRFFLKIQDSIFSNFFVRFVRHSWLWGTKMWKIGIRWSWWPSTVAMLLVVEHDRGEFNNNLFQWWEENIIL